MEPSIASALSHVSFHIPGIFPRDAYILVFGIARDVSAHRPVDIDPQSPGRMLGLAKDVGAIVDTVEVDGLVQLQVFSI